MIKNPGTKQWGRMQFFAADVNREEMEKTIREILAQNQTEMSEEALQQQLDENCNAEYWRGGIAGKEEYQVTVYNQDEPAEGWPKMIHLSFKRVDREAMHDWRIFQAIKNAIVGPNHEAVELYPSEERRVDGANQYHLWVVADEQMHFPFGFSERNVTYEDPKGGGKQRPETI